MCHTVYMLGKVTKMLVGVLFVLFLLFILKFFGLSIPLNVTNSTVSSELSVVGEGSVDVTPDLAVITVGVSVQNEQSAEAVKTKIDKVNNAVIAAMKKIGIKQDDIQSTNYSINPSYDDRGTGITGYNGSVSIEIKARNTSLASKIIEEATNAGANEIYGTQFTVEHPENYREMARTKAIANAKEQAEKLSKELGIHLGKITNLEESSPASYPLPYAYGMGGKAMAADSGTAFEQGSQTITSTVTVYFEKK